MSDEAVEIMMGKLKPKVDWAKETKEQVDKKVS